MASDPKTEDDWTIHAINIHGIFFERWCQQAISDSGGWILKSTNYPVEYPPPNGPLRGRESALDIRSEKDFADARISLLIECKKNNPEFVNWVFFRKYPYPSKNSFIVSRIQNTSNEPPATGWSVKSSLKHLDSTYPITNEARETRSDYLTYKDSGRKTKTANAAITDAAYQVALATEAIAYEDALFSTSLGSSTLIPPMPWRFQLFFPVIVTTARLYVCEFQPSDIDPQNGEIDYHKAKMTEYSSLVYEYVLPRHLQSQPADLVKTLTEGSIEIFMRMHIFVVYSGHFKEFLETFYYEQNEPKE